MVAGPSRRPRGQGQVHRSVADMLPIIESSTSPPPSDVASNLSAGTNNSNGAGFFRTYQEGTPRGVSSRSNGALTPDLNFAEIGHGRGTNDIPTSVIAHSQLRRGQESTLHQRQPFVEIDRRSPRPRLNTSRQGPGELTNDQSSVAPPPIMYQYNNQMQAHAPSVVWPYREPIEATSPNQDLTPTRDSQEPVQSSLGGDSRGRSVKRSLRNTFNVAEHYASSFLFGRSSNGPDDGNVSNTAGGSGSGNAHGR